jgi:hypothetical protein
MYYSNIFCIFAENAHSYLELAGIGSFLTTKSQKTFCALIIYKTSKTSKRKFFVSDNFLYWCNFRHCVVTPIMKCGFFVFCCILVYFMSFCKYFQFL